MIDLAWYLQNLLRYSLQLGLLIGAAALAHALFPIQVPRLSYAYWRIMLLACLLLPATESWPVPARGTTSALPVAEIQVLPGTRLPAGPPPEAEAQFPYLPVLAGVLAAGVVFRLARVLVGAVSLRRALRRARPVALPWEIGQLAPGIGLQPRVCFVDGVNGPATYGFLRPVILLPADFSDLTETQQLGVICHELRHVRRRDWLYRLAEEIVRSTFWFHPLVLWLTNRVELSREQCVDQEVVQMLGRSRDYLDSLVEMASARISGPVAALFVSESHLAQRVRLIKEGFTMSIRRLAISLCVSCVILIAAGSLAIWAFPLQGREQEQAPPAGAAAGTAMESQKRGPESETGETKEPIKVGGNVATSKIVHWVPPEYPPDAEKARVKGLVLATVSITEEGNVSNVEVLRGHPMLTQAAVAAIHQWRYSPTVLSGHAVPVIATQAVSFPPGKEPDKLPSGQPFPFDPDTVVQLRLDETGALFMGSERLDNANLAQALQGKNAIVFGVPQNEPSIEIIEKTIKMLEQAGGRVQFYSPSYGYYVNGRITHSEGMTFPLRGLPETGKTLGYAWYRWVFTEDGQRIRLHDSQIPGASEGAIAAARARLDTWDVTGTYQLTLDNEGRITDVKRIGGSGVPSQLDEFAAGLVGKVYRGRTPASTVEFEISFR